MQSLVPYSEGDTLWFSHSGPEHLVVGHSDSISAPGLLADALHLGAAGGCEAMLTFGRHFIESSGELVYVDDDNTKGGFGFNLVRSRTSANDWRQTDCQ